MGLQRISIDFSKCINNIIVIKGDNGSGKSSLFKAIHPFSDTNYYLLPEVEASKNIVYLLNDGSVLDITYIYPIDSKKNRKSTQCFISLNGKDMNPNHNINDGKSVICDILDIDMGFLTLAQLSSDDRGLADKNPSERKKFINKKISELDAYNEMYKKISKKSTQLKGMVNSFNTKLTSIGDTKTIATNIKLLNGQLESLDEQKTLLLVEMSKIQTKMEDLMNSTNFNPDSYNRLKQTIYELRQNLSRYHIDESITESAKLEEEMSYRTHISNLENMQNMYDKRLSEVSSIRDKVESLEIRLSSMGDPKLINSYEFRIKEIKKKQEEFNLACHKHGFDRHEEISETEYDYVYDTMCNISRYISTIRDRYDYKTLSKSITIFCNQVYGKPYERKTSKNELETMKDNLSNMRMIIEKQEFFKEQSRDFSMIPEDCPHKHDCPFIKTIMSAYNSILPDSDYDELSKQIEVLSSDISKYKVLVEEEDNIDRCILDMIHIFGSNSEIMKPSCMKSMEKFGIHYISCKEDFKPALDSLLLSSNTEWYILDLQYYDNIRNFFIESKSYRADIEHLQKECSSLRSNQELSEFIMKELSESKEKLQSFNTEISSMNQNIQSLQSTIDNQKRHISQMQHMLEMKKKQEEEQKQYDLLTEEYNKQQENMKEYDILDRELSNKKSILDDLVSHQIPAITKAINESKYKIVLYNDYVKEYKEYRASYEKVEVIKKYCAPTTGIQTIYMNMYMNDILGISNDILSSFFNGEFILQRFVINEKEFRMPVLGLGIMNDDISSMSTSQICMISMIISFALMSKSSSIYNIIKLDEIDGGLDTNNRLVFFNSLMNLMRMMNFQQCIMISHNTELNMSNTDIIILKNSDPTMVVDGNVIYDYATEA
jgi:hypothetical protein